ncbi:ComF family protein [Gordonia crocea]|uniref:Phosphoribosyltransferase n=1 Tax=Gordonia crocea TaxID=589162 RepID=A0A7I9V246_9ACTN|nr:ComF family protein [Gordonia crocea]GED99497.1 hypothetical protein nbrc107697_35360 [Gordonia crocea]
MEGSTHRFTPAELARALADLVAPVVCGGCGTPETPWCPRCARSLADVPRLVEPATPVAAAVWVLGPYRGPLRAAIIAVKEHGRRDLVDPIGHSLARAAVTLFRWRELPDAPRLVLVPAPTRAVAARRRGGDPVTAYARAAARRLGSRVVVAPVLHTGGWVRDSAGLDAGARRANLHGSIRCDTNHLRSLELSPDDVVVLLDDVVTTGSTAAESVRILARRGVPVAVVLAIAAAD